MYKLVFKSTSMSDIKSIGDYLYTECGIDSFCICMDDNSFGSTLSSKQYLEALTYGSIYADKHHMIDMVWMDSDGYERSNISDVAWLAEHRMTMCHSLLSSRDVNYLVEKERQFFTSSEDDDNTEIM